MLGDKLVCDRVDNIILVCTDNQQLVRRQEVQEQRLVTDDVSKVVLIFHSDRDQLAVSVRGLLLEDNFKKFYFVFEPHSQNGLVLLIVEN